MYTVMVTGGLGSGKSTLVDLLCELGAISIDLDKIGRTVLESDDQVKRELAEEFGDDILDGFGDIIRSKLAERAFVCRETVEAMNAITFPRITALATEYIFEHCFPRTDRKIMVVEVQILEGDSEFAGLADEIIAVCAPLDLRVERAVARGMDEDDARRRIELQASDVERAHMADTICYNDGDLETLRAWAKRWYDDCMEHIAAAEQEPQS